MLDILIMTATYIKYPTEIKMRHCCMLLKKFNFLKQIRKQNEQKRQSKLEKRSIG